MFNTGLFFYWKTLVKFFLFVKVSSDFVSFGGGLGTYIFLDLNILEPLSLW